MKDLVCGMDVTTPAKHSSFWKGEDYAFCSAGCKSKFDSEPAKYAGREAVSGSMPILMTEKPNFTPLILIIAGIVVLTAAKYFFIGGSGMQDAIIDFMGMFFIVFGGFKLLDVKGFADAYATYDIIARKSRLYALAYPFIEVALGVAFLIRWNVQSVNWITLIIMSIGSIGVAKAIAKKQKIQCTCLGTKIKLPMTKITLIEDVTMALMALGMLIFGL